MAWLPAGGTTSIPSSPIMLGLATKTTPVTVVICAADSSSMPASDSGMETAIVAARSSARLRSPSSRPAVNTRC